MDGTGSWYACCSQGLNNKVNQYRICGDRCKTDPEYRKKFVAKISLSLKKFKQEHPDFMVGCNNPMYGKKHTLSTRLKLSANHSGKLNTNFGKMWITNAELQENKRILKTDDIPEGWVKGRKFYNKQ